MSGCRFVWRRASRVIIMLAVPTVVAASNLNYLKDAPITHFDKKDKALFNDAVQQTLTHAPDGEERRWSNPESGAKGELTVVQTLSQGHCRQLRIVNHARGRIGTTTMVFCRQKDDKWAPAKGKTP